MTLDRSDVELRTATYRAFVDLGRAPLAGELASRLGLEFAEIRAGWRRLHDAHALVLDDDGDIRMANPFSAVPTPYRVEAAGKEWYANCGWDAFGIGAALHVDSVIHSACPDCDEPIRLQVRDAQPDDTSLVFHVLVPAATWWHDIGFT